MTQYLTIRFPSTKMTYYGLRISEYLASRVCTLCLGTETPVPVTGAAVDEYNLNVVDCDASVTVARPAVSQWGSGGYPLPPEANVNLKDVYGFPWPPPGLLGILRKTQFLRYYSVREANLSVLSA